MDHFTLPPAFKSPSPEILHKIEEAIQSFSVITDVPVTFFNTNGEIQWECHRQSKFCNFFDVYKDPRSVCSKNLASSAKLATQLGEPYVFVCKAGLVKIAVSLILNGQVAGCFMAGPIIMGGLKESIITNVFSLNNIHFDSYPKIILFLRSMKIFKPKEVSHLASLLGSCVLASITHNEDYASINSQYKEQKRIGENLQRYKKENKTMPYPYELENQLIESVKDGDTNKSLSLLKKLLGELSLIEVGDVTSIKTKVLGICTILSRIAAEKSSLSQEQTESYFYDMNMLNQAVSFQELSILASNLIENISQVIASSSYSGKSQIIKQAIQNINENYKNRISLKTVADYLHTNPSYLSVLFKQEMGMTFTDYLNQTRINKSCELLANTGINLIDVSMQSGFDDQSYFSKVFKKMKGITPKDYRKVNAK
ncbi:helix-turn-helix domain-containing protein [Sinanaerobacter chloroacetimidivorans]|uniref:AraC family transcriptional regulator n=1 Tax=Sinanaerobacter chloroacetimidivorans TaxID=2818044 RepID=A0A8J7W3Z5_9FIRM|nr:helix-turn-helix domain-containing protein [Sinanaerobacter chloroacetimidivorans]MBR0598800.1 AraC family transcriptional regulator [Sinanaerobacter chloroacetimidivorans]